MKGKHLKPPPLNENKQSKITESISLPELEKFPKINSFYKKLSARCRTFCSDVLPSLYDSNHLFYCIRGYYKEKDGLLEVKLRVTLSDRRAMRLLYSSEQTHLWRQKDQLLIKIKKQTVSAIETI